MPNPTLQTLRETRQWLTELRRWGSMVRPVLARAVEKGRLQAKARRPVLGTAATQATDALVALGFKRAAAEIAVREAVAEDGSDDVDTLLRSAARRLR